MSAGDALKTSSLCNLEAAILQKRGAPPARCKQKHANSQIYNHHVSGPDFRERKPSFLYAAEFCRIPGETRVLPPLIDVYKRRKRLLEFIDLQATSVLAPCAPLATFRMCTSSNS